MQQNESVDAHEWRKVRFTCVINVTSLLHIPEMSWVPGSGGKESIHIRDHCNITPTLT